MKILIVTVGTQGDVQPHVALGRALMKSGHETTICTCASFGPFIQRPESLVEFLSGCEPPVHLGFGSILGEIQSMPRRSFWKQSAVPECGRFLPGVARNSHRLKLHAI